MAEFLISSDEEAQVRRLRESVVVVYREINKLRDSTDDTPERYQDLIATCEDSLSSAIDDLDQILTHYVPKS